MGIETQYGESVGRGTDFRKSGVSRYADSDLGVQRVRCQVGVPLAQQPHIGHNRWHPGIPPLAEVNPGEEIILETPGYDDYQLRDEDDDQDIHKLDLSRVHP